MSDPPPTTDRWRLQWTAWQSVAAANRALDGSIFDNFCIMEAGSKSCRMRDGKVRAPPLKQIFLTGPERVYAVTNRNE